MLPLFFLSYVTTWLLPLSAFLLERKRGRRTKKNYNLQDHHNSSHVLHVSRFTIKLFNKILNWIHSGIQQVFTFLPGGILIPALSVRHSHWSGRCPTRYCDRYHPLCLLIQSKYRKENKGFQSTHVIRTSIVGYL